jgi:HAD superfamily hydrolase (TIGR01549 family)
MPSAFPGVDAGLEAVIFDFDGVIVESMDIKTDAFRALFADHPERLDAIVALHRRHAGIDRLVKFEMIYRDILHLPLDEKQKRALARRFEALVESQVTACPMVEGAAKLLALLEGHVPLVVVSGTPEGELKRIIERRGLARYFRAVRGSPGAKTEILRDLLREESWNPRHMLMVGDADSDFAAARENGLNFVGRVPPGQASPFPAEVPVVTDLTGLAAAVASLRPMARSRNMKARTR